jgi:hypothetical protein
LVIAWSPTDVVFNGGFCTLEYGSGPPACGPPEVRVERVHVATLDQPRTSEGGVISGRAYLVGTIEGGVLHVEEQGPPRADGGFVLTNSPCAAPRGGWAAGPRAYRSEAAYRYARRHPGEVVSLDVLFPRPNVGVMTIASTAPGRTEAALKTDFPRSLCVVRSRYTREEVRHAATVARYMVTPETAGAAPDWVNEVRVNLGPDGQPQVRVSVTFDNPAVRHGVASLPAGLVAIVPWLAPTQG